LPALATPPQHCDGEAALGHCRRERRLALRRGGEMFREAGDAWEAIMLAGAAALTIAALMSGADAQIERGPAALSGQAQNFTPVEKAA